MKRRLIQRLVTSGTFELDGGSWDVDNNIWIVGDDKDVVVFDAAVVGWLAERNKFSRNYAAPFLFKLLRLRLVTPIKVYAHFDGCLIDDMMTMEARAFSMSYFDFEQGHYLKDYCALSRSSPDNILRTRFTWLLYAAMLRRIDERFRRWGGSIRTRGRALAA